MLFYNVHCACVCGDYISISILSESEQQISLLPI